MMNLVTYHCPNCSHWWNLVSINPQELGHCPKCPEGFIEPKNYIDPNLANKFFKDLLDTLNNQR